MMKYCQECGSEIGETVTFCPYCGISQKTVQEKEEAASQDKTIALDQWELADLVGNKIETVSEDLPDKKSEISPQAKVELAERQETIKESVQPLNVVAERQAAESDSTDVSPQFILNTDDSFQLTPEDSFKLISEKKALNLLQDDPPNKALKTFDEKAEIFLKSQIELQRMIFIQNQRIIELLEQLLKKTP